MEFLRMKDHGMARRNWKSKKTYTSPDKIRNQNLILIGKIDAINFPREILRPAILEETLPSLVLLETTVAFSELLP